MRLETLWGKIENEFGYTPNYINKCVCVCVHTHQGKLVWKNRTGCWRWAIGHLAERESGDTASKRNRRAMMFRLKKASVFVRCEVRAWEFWTQKAEQAPGKQGLPGGRGGCSRAQRVALQTSAGDTPRRGVGHPSRVLTEAWPGSGSQVGTPNDRGDVVSADLTCSNSFNPPGDDLGEGWREWRSSSSLWLEVVRKTTG